ncbi:hypothetical protein EPN96_07520 [bacterium]|nr:MAG: hypothetical protein EPN96_07520 [bacterium]
MNSLGELTREELFCVITKLRSVLIKDNVMLSAISKLNRHQELRYECRVPTNEALSLENVRGIFTAERKFFPEDAGQVVVYLFSDPYRAPDYVELDVEIYGHEGRECLPIFYIEFTEETRKLASFSFKEVGWVGPSLIRSLFKEKLLKIMAEMGMHIYVNPGYLTEMKLDPLNGAEDMPVYAEPK